MGNGRYVLKRAVLAPRRAYTRRRTGDQPDRARTMLELHSYSRDFLEFVGATVENPDLLHEWLPAAHRRRRAIRRTLRRSHDEEWCHDRVWELWRRREVG